MIRSNKLLPLNHETTKPLGTGVNPSVAVPGDGYEGGAALIGDKNLQMVGIKASPKRGRENRVGDGSAHSEHRANQGASINAGYTDNRSMAHQNANPNFLPSIQGSQKRSGTSAKE